MSDSESLSLAYRWITFAHDDLRAASALLATEDVLPNQACFHAQQAAEKALKAALASLQLEFPYTHDLGRLATLLAPEWAESLSGFDFDTL